MSMRVITGDETGLLKFIDISKKSVSVFGNQTRTGAIKGISWIVRDESIAILRANKQTELWNVCDGNLSISSSYSASSFSIPKGLVAMEKHIGSALLYDNEGHVSIAQRDEQNELHETGSFETRGPVDACASCERGAVFGGCENDLQMWDIETQQVVWKAKNVSNDKLRLRVPIWITAVGFIDDDSSSVSGATIVSGTGYKQVRLYDTRVKRQPITSIDIGEYRVTSIMPSKDCESHAVYVADTSGQNSSPYLAI